MPAKRGGGGQPVLINLGESRPVFAQLHRPPFPASDSAPSPEAYSRSAALAWATGRRPRDKHPGRGGPSACSPAALRRSSSSPTRALCLPGGLPCAGTRPAAGAVGPDSPPRGATAQVAARTLPPPPPSLTGTYRRGAGGRPPPPPLLPPSNGCSGGGGAAPSPPRLAWPRPQRRRRHFNLPRRPLCSRRSPMMRPLPAPSRSRPPASPPLITLRSDARTRAAPPPAPALGLAYRPHLLRARTIWRTGAEKRRPGRMPQVLEEGAAFRAGLFRWASSLGGLKETDGCRGERESPHVRPSRPVFPPQGARSSTAGERLPPLPGRSRCWVLPHARAL